MRILVTGGTGFVGSKLVESLFRKGHEITVITRNAQRAQKRLGFPVQFIEGNLVEETIDELTQINFNSVINLAGENIGEGKWTDEEKKKIKKSRVNLTKNLVSSLNHASLNTFIQASAIGFYRDSIADEWLDEETEKADFFLADICNEWESEALKLPSSVRVVIPRIGVILGHDGALMSKLIPLYRSGFGGKLSDGQQWMSWVHVEDVVRFIEFSLGSQKVRGFVNLTAPNPVQNNKFNKVLAKFTQRPALFTVPEFALRLTMGEKAYLALSNQRISTKAEKEFDFKFNYPSIESACAEVCNFEKLYGENSEGFHYRLRKSMFLPSQIEHVYDFFARPANLKKVAPRNLKLELIKSSDERLTKNSTFTFRMIKFGVPVRISSKVCDIAENEFFADVQTSGPFQTWLHSHLFYEVEGGTIVVDDLKYRLPFGLLGDMASSKANKDVEDMFKHRMQSIREYFGESK